SDGPVLPTDDTRPLPLPCVHGVIPRGKVSLVHGYPESGSRFPDLHVGKGVFDMMVHGVHLPVPLPEVQCVRGTFLALDAWVNCGRLAPRRAASKSVRHSTAPIPVGSISLTTRRLPSGFAVDENESPEHWLEFEITTGVSFERLFPEALFPLEALLTFAS